MSTLATTLTVLGAQLVLGAAFYALGSVIVVRLARRGPREDRRLILSWVEASRVLVRALPFSIALGIAGVAVYLFLGQQAGSFAVWASPLAYVAVGAPATASCLLVVRSGLLERRGRVAAARRQVRTGGLVMFAGSFADVDGTFGGLAIVANTAAAEGAWQYSSDGGTSWKNVGAVGDDATALVVSAATRLRFDPAANWNGSPPDLLVRALGAALAEVVEERRGDQVRRLAGPEGQVEALQRVVEGVALGVEARILADPRQRLERAQQALVDLVVHMGGPASAAG